MPRDVRSAVEEVLGGKGDSDVLEYVIGCLEDETFEWGEGAEEANDNLGPMLVGAGCVTDEGAALDVCRRLQALLQPDTGAAAAQPDAAFRALAGGPIMLDELNRVSLHPSDVVSGKHLIQGVFRESDDADFSLMSERDAAKIKRQADRTAKQERAAYEAHRSAADEALAGRSVEVVRNAGGPAIKDVHLRDVCVSNGGAELIVDSDISLAFGRRYGLVGRNGTGKSTLLRALSSRQIPGLPFNFQVLHVEQEIAGDDTPAVEAVLACDTERTRLMQEEAALLAAATPAAGPPPATSTANGPANANGTPSSTSNGTATAPSAAAAAPAEPDQLESARRLEAVSRRLHEIEAYTAESRAASILAGLSFDTEMQRRPTKSLSGGWRMRVALARALFVQPDLLLLDEPTNHLDLHAVLWLQDYLVKWPKTLVVVSHAREFLNCVCTDVLHLHSRSIVSYKGNYDIFEKTMHERMRNARAAADAQESRRAQMQQFIDKFRYNAKRASLVQSRIKALERMAEVSLVEDDAEYRFTFPTPPDVVSPPILSFTDVSFGYPGGPELFHDLNFGLDLDSRLAIVGPNGIGKSTLLGLIGGTLQPTKGHVYRNPKVRLAVFSQHHVDGMDLALTPLAYLAVCFPGSKDPQRRSHLASFGVGSELAVQPMYTLSGGQKSRVALAKVTWSQPHLLLLDEPSNHLDLDAVDALIRGLAAFGGGVLLVSHDQHLIEAAADELWEVMNGSASPFPGTFEEYKARLKKLAK